MKNKKPKGILKVFAFVILFLFTEFVAVAQDTLDIKKHTYSAKKFERKMQKKNTQVLDVRTPAEYKEGHLPNALLIDVQDADFKEKIAQLDKDKTYLIYCRSGKRSQKALKMMADAGFQKLYHLKGGYTSWDGEKVQ